MVSYVQLYKSEKNGDFSWFSDDKNQSKYWFLLVYNITSRPSFDEIAMLRDKILRAKDEEKVPMYVFFLFFNKLTTAIIAIMIKPIIKRKIVNSSIR